MFMLGKVGELEMFFPSSKMRREVGARVFKYIAQSDRIHSAEIKTPVRVG